MAGRRRRETGRRRPLCESLGPTASGALGGRAPCRLCLRSDGAGGTRLHGGRRAPLRTLPRRVGLRLVRRRTPRGLWRRRCLAREALALLRRPPAPTRRPLRAVAPV